MPNNGSTKWTHPAHKGLRSPQYNALSGDLLDDERIEAYILLGYYGSRRQRELKDRLKLSKKNPPGGKTKTKHNVQISKTIAGLLDL